jgi:Dyp-type peroxidase family
MSLSDQLSDVQGVLLRGYGRLRGARFLLLAVRDPTAARRWLGALDIRSAESNPGDADTAVNVALTPTGLAAFGFDAATLATFPREFCEGMTGTPHRQRILGDTDQSDPVHWSWGGPRNPQVDVLLLVYAGDDSAVAALSEREVERARSSGLEVVHQLDSGDLPDGKEHFGFRDGIARTRIAGLDEGSDLVAAGEFVLGHHNAYGQLPPSPTVEPHRLLPDSNGRGDFGRNGSFLVFRQLSQNVKAFWQAMDTAAGGDVTGSVTLAAKMVGRWPGGAPLVNSPDRDDPALSRDDDFLYHRSGDPHGLRCPIGAHIRRSNPRDALDPVPGSDRSIEVGKRHRLLRRGRTYGPPLTPSLDAASLLAADDDGRERGLHFLCFNAHLGRQFEFIQHTWVNNPKFDGLYADDDPLIGARGNGESGTFTIQAEPVRRRVTALPRFVQVRGGAYFFVPSMSALRYLSQRGGQA